MNVLLINQFFWPDNAPTAQLLADLANHLVEQGCSVTVYCGSGSYEKKAPKGAPSVLKGVRVVRSPTLQLGHSFAWRLLSYFMFLSGSILLGLWGRRPDIVITLTTPPMLGIAGTVLRRLTGARHFSWEMDLYPEVGIDLGVFSPQRLFIRGLVQVASVIRRRSDGILALGTCMRQRLIQSGVAPEKIYITENWANGEVIFPDRSRPANERFTIHYAGNLGLAHDVDTMAAAMTEIGNDPRFEFIFSGGGRKRPALEQLCSSRALRNVRFLPYCDTSGLAEMFSRGDVGLVTQIEECFGSVVPSKLYAYLAAGTPVLYIGPPETTSAKILEQHACGWRIDCGDANGLRTLLEELAVQPEQVSRAGRNAREAFLANYDLPIGVGRISAALKLSDMTSRRPPVTETMVAPHT